MKQVVLSLLTKYDRCSAWRPNDLATPIPPLCQIDKLADPTFGKLRSEPQYEHAEISPMGLAATVAVQRIIA